MGRNSMHWCRIGVSAAIILIIGSVESSRAGGPLLVSNGQPVLWDKGPVRGGRLNTMTVDEQGRVIYRVDMGDLGPIAHADAVKLVDRIFNEYSSIGTSTIRFVNGGPILDPDTHQPVDVTAANYGRFASSSARTYQNPIIFDSDGSITGRGGVLGYVFPLNFRGVTMRESVVVLNGATVGLAGGTVPFLGVFTHEFGHFAGPLDHSQVNGRIGSGSRSADLPPGFSTGDLYDLFAPFTETLYPFLYGAPLFGSNLAVRGYRNSGYFTATIDMDMRIALSNLYPAPGYLSSDPTAKTGSITGRIVARTDTFELPICGINVVARRVSRGVFPPPAGTEAFPGGRVPLDADGVPFTPPDQAATDPLATATSVVSGLIGEPGTYQFNGLPPGDYQIYMEGINPSAVAGSGIGQFDPPILVLTPEYYNGVNESNNPATDNPKAFVPVAVTAASVTPGIDLVLNGFGGPVSSLAESEPNDSVAQAQILPPQAQVLGSVAQDDPATVTLDLRTEVVRIHDLYRIQVTTPANLLISLHADDPNVDIDLYFFNNLLKDGKNDLNSRAVVGTSNGPTGDELLVTQKLMPGAYFIGVSGYGDSTKYHLTVLNTAEFTPAATAGNSAFMRSSSFQPGIQISDAHAEFSQVLGVAILAGKLYGWALGL